MFVAAGHYRKGIMLSPVTGKIVADLITKGATGLPAEAFRPERFPLAPAI
jgi:glycine oxidase